MNLDPLREGRLLINRRHFFGRTATGLGAAALGSLLNPGLFSSLAAENDPAKAGLGASHFPGKARQR